MTAKNSEIVTAIMTEKLNISDIIIPIDYGK